MFKSNTFTFSFNAVSSSYFFRDFYLVDENLMILHAKDLKSENSLKHGIIEIKRGKLIFRNQDVLNKVISYIKNPDLDIIGTERFYLREQNEIWLIKASQVQNNTSESTHPVERYFIFSIENLTKPPSTIKLHLLKDILKVTSTEMRLCEALITGKNLRQAAEDAFISYEHARQRLKVIFEKTSTSNQSQLVAFLNRALILLGE